MAKISKILLALDVVGDTNRVCGYANMIAKAFDAEVHAVYVMTSMRKYMKLTGRKEDVTGLREDASKNAKDMLDRIVAEKLPGVKCLVHVLGGESPSGPILSFAASEDCDLIIMGTRSLKGVNRLIFGSVAEKVVQLSEIPVMTIGPEDADE